MRREGPASALGRGRALWERLGAPDVFLPSGLRSTPGPASASDPFAELAPFFEVLGSADAHGRVSSALENLEAFEARIQGLVEHASLVRDMIVPFCEDLMEEPEEHRAKLVQLFFERFGDSLPGLPVPALSLPDRERMRSWLLYESAREWFRVHLTKLRARSREGVHEYLANEAPRLADLVHQHPWERTGRITDFIRGAKAPPSRGADRKRENESLHRYLAGLLAANGVGLPLSTFFRQVVDPRAS